MCIGKGNRNQILYLNIIYQTNNQTVISKFLKGLFQTGKKAKKGIEDSMDFIDEVLEKEYITGSIQKVKDASGDMVESAGTAYQKTKDTIDDNIDTQKIKAKANELMEKGKGLTSELSENMLDSSETLKNVMNEGKEFFNKLFEEEE